MIEDNYSHHYTSSKLTAASATGGGVTNIDNPSTATAVFATTFPKTDHALPTRGRESSPHVILNAVKDPSIPACLDGCFGR